MAPVVTLLLTLLLAGERIDVSFTAMMMSIAQIVLLPIVLGLAMNHFLSGGTKKIQPLLPLISSVAALVVVHNVCGLSLGYFAAKIFRMDSRKVRAVAIEVGMQNSALAVSSAIIYFTPDTGRAADVLSAGVALALSSIKKSPA